MRIITNITVITKSIREASLKEGLLPFPFMLYKEYVARFILCGLD